MTRRIQSVDQARLILSYDPDYAQTKGVQSYLKSHPGASVGDYVDKLSDAYVRRVAGSLEKGRSLSEARGHKEEIVRREERAKHRKAIERTKKQQAAPPAGKPRKTSFQKYMEKNPYRTEREFVSGKKDVSPLLKLSDQDWYEAERQTLRVAGRRYSEILRSRIDAGIKVEAGQVVPGAATTPEDLARFESAWKDYRKIRLEQLEFIRTEGQGGYARYRYWDLRDQLKSLYDYMLSEFDLVDTRDDSWGLFHYH